VTREEQNSTLQLQSQPSAPNVHTAFGNSFAQPFINVQILGKSFPALLDTGSSDSIIGDEVISWVKSLEVQIDPCSKIIHSLQSSIQVNHFTMVPVDFSVGSVNIKLHFVPGTIKTVLLGRDFLRSAQIGLFIEKGGWSVANDPENIIPFIESDQGFLVKPLGTNNSLQVNTSSLPEEILDQDLIDCLYISPTVGLADTAVEVEPDIEELASYQTEVPLFPEFPEGIKVPESLAEEDIRDLREDLREFLPMFTKKPGLCTLYEHTIETGSAKSIKGSLRPISRGKRVIYDECFDELVKYDLIEPSTSPWASNAFLVPKPCGGLRFVINYKPLNKITEPDVNPVNRIEDMLAFLGEANYFTVLDCTKGFYQIPVKESDRPKTAFISHRGLWCNNLSIVSLREMPKIKRTV